ncbi:MAG: NADP-dependent oxidoreductase [Alphaproteobacteria bacterium]|jgi:NADPH-dependent curcumin reductase CurA|nr:NADP-dependent oxidoreductase [Alphaproteobacteria bacterium]
MTANRRFVLARRPQGLPVVEDFRLETVDLPAPGDGQVIVANRFVSVDPGMRSRLSAAETYAAPLAIGAVVEGATVGQVVASNNPKFMVGDWVASAFGWQEFGLSDGRGMRKLADDRVPPSTAIGVLGIPGITAYFGLQEIGRVKEGETVLVSSAAGAVGSAAGQIAAIKGASAVGIAGGPEKCRWLTDDLGFAAAIDRRAEPDIAAAVARACPDGVDVFFDNVGNALIDAMLPLMRRGGRIVVSGQVADYNAGAERPGIVNTQFFITSRLTMAGLVAFDYVRAYPQAWAEMTDWIVSGRLKYREDVVDGLEQLPGAFIGLFKGENFGRKLIRLP